ncbi:MAG: 50S ribosomal protein L9 [Epsilonproteobacteria bacterium]|nr:50S ribosomal protein L9 [Campylobacterota bacterium]
MKVLLIKDVATLGKVGEIKEVSDGYGKNFLIGKGFAKHATPAVMAEWEENQKEMKAKLEAEIEVAKKQKEMIEALKLTIKHKVGENSHLFGSITNKEIALALHEQFQLDVDKKHISLKNPIKTIGIFTADCKLGHGQNASLTIDVIAL